jgi:hypothetical protein
VIDGREFGGATEHDSATCTSGDRTTAFLLPIAGALGRKMPGQSSQFNLHDPLVDVYLVRHAIGASRAIPRVR